MKKGQKKLGKELWEKIRQEYISSDISQRELAKKYGLSESTIAVHCKEGQWVESRAKYTEKMAQKCTERLGRVSTTLFDHALSVSEKILIKIEKQIDNALKTDTPILGSELKSYTGAIKDLREMGFFRAALDRQEQEARIRKLEKECEDEKGDTTIQIILDDGMLEDAD